MEAFKEKTVYQIYPKSFQDSNGDGIGDLCGIISRLDYLQRLGADFLWLTPFFPSPQRDNGYDVAEYMQVDPVFGTMEDFEELVEEAGRRGMGLMLDMVFNHTSTEHEWFRRALAGEQEYIDYYIFRDGNAGGPPTDWQSKFGGPAWEYVPRLGKWYLHLFDVTQADLNWENPRVREELKKVIRFWKDKGVRGFRFDVVNLISKPEVFANDPEGDGRRFYTDGPHVHEYLKELTADTGIGNMVTVGEMSSTSLADCIRYSNPAQRELSMCFSFHHLKVDYKNGNKWELMPPDLQALKKLLTDWQLGMQEHDGWNALFWCNHDQPRIVSRLGDEKRYWKESAKMLAASIHLLRGTPYIYQGEELGMTNAHFKEIEQYRDVESLNFYRIMLEEGRTKEEALQILDSRSRDNGRTPMQWDDSKNAGFSSGTPWLECQADFSRINAQQQEEEEGSILNFYRRLIRLRKEKKVISEGKIAFLCGEEPGVFTYRRTLGEEELLVVNNLTGQRVTAHVMPENGSRRILGNYEEEPAVVEEGIMLRPFETVVWER